MKVARKNHVSYAHHLALAQVLTTKRALISPASSSTTVCSSRTSTICRVKPKMKFFCDILGDPFQQMKDE